MRQSRSLVRTLGIVVAVLGVVVCLGLIVAVWVTGSRLGRATERLFRGSERGLSVAGERLVRTRSQIAMASNAAAEIELSLVDWTHQNTSQRGELKQTAAEKTTQLALILEECDLWLEIVESTVTRVDELLSSSAEESPSGENTSADQLVDDLAALRSTIAEAITATNTIQERLNDPSRAELGFADHITRRLLTPLRSADTRLAAAEQRLSAARRQVQEFSARVQRWILTVMIGGSLLLLWMAVGQAALGWWAWTTFRERQSASPLVQ